MKIIPEFGKLIHEKRRSLHLTEETLAERSDLSDRHLRNIESGNAMPKLDTVIKLGNALNINLGELGDFVITDETE